MSILGKLMDGMRLNDPDEDDDYYLDDDYEDEGDRPSKKSIFSKRTEEDYYDDEEEYEKPRFLSRSPKVVPIKQQRAMEVSMLRPTTIEDAKEVCDHLLAGKAVVLNMEGIHTDDAQRIIDFTSGATYSMNGNLQKISSFIFIATPESVELSGDFQDLLQNSTLDMGGMSLRL